MADLAPVYAALQKADAAGDTAAATQLANYIRSQGGQRPLDPSEYDPTSPAYQAKYGATSGMTGPQKFAAGYGKAAVDLGRGAGQLVGAVSRQDVADARARDAALMQTGAGKWGNIIGTGADLLPAAFIPGANTIAGSAAIGTGLGLLQPSTGTLETALNTGLGGLLAPASILAGRGVGALYQGGKAALEPLFKGGQQRIAARTLQAFAGGPEASQAAAQELESAGRNVLPGVQPTTMELTGNAGLAQLGRTVANQPEALAALGARASANRGAMTSALEDIAGTPGKYADTAGLRADFSRPLYEQAAAAKIEPDTQLTALLNRPSLKSAWTRAQQLAEERGEPMLTSSPNVAQPNGPQDLQLTGKTLQYLKMGLNDMISAGPQQGIGSHELGALKSTLSDLNSWIGKNVPALRRADYMYRWASGPLNEMDIGTALRNKLIPALGDFGQDTRLNANNFASALRNGDAIAADVTGNPAAKLTDVLSPQQQTTTRQIAEQLARAANAADRGRAVGSNTGQNLVSQNVLRQMLGPLGLPQGMGERAAQSTLGQTLMRPVQWAGKLAEPDIMTQLTQAALDPAKAAALLRTPQGSRAAQLLWQRHGLLTPLGAQAGQAIPGLLGYAPQ